mmetsp:Transcript_2579/g.7697  ORF Transcript_2579/g.7697 Transcript_2579/m.7697 type:complete len:262 (+) Transcript_2579:1226-2011(+)
MMSHVYGKVTSAHPERNHTASHHLGRDKPQGPTVVTSTGLFLPHHFRGGVGPVHVVLRRRVAADELSTAEVNKHDFVNTALNEHILRPQIPVDKPLCMHMTQSTTHLRQERPRKDWIRSIAENHGGELLRLRDIVHRYTEVGWLTTRVRHGFGALQHVDDAHNVRMRQVRHRERLEASAMLRRVAERNELHSNPVASDPVRRHDYNRMLALANLFRFRKHHTIVEPFQGTEWLGALEICFGLHGHRSTRARRCLCFQSACH